MPFWTASNEMIASPRDTQIIIILIFYSKLLIYCLFFIIFINKSNGMVKIIENYTLHEQIG